MKVGTILLARMGSSRLPGKVMLKLQGKPVLGHIVDRLKRVDQSETIVVATTRLPKDDVIADYCTDQRIAIFRGSENNILERCIKAAEAFDLDVIVRLGADTPFIDWDVIDSMLARLFESQTSPEPLEYVGNTMIRSYPVGLDADIMSVALLRRLRTIYEQMPAEERALNQSNVIPYIHQNPDAFRTLAYSEPFDLSHLRWTLDTPEDFELIRKIYDALYPAKPDFQMQDILDLVDRHPRWSQINAHTVPQTGYWTPHEKQKFKKRYGQ